MSLVSGGKNDEESNSGNHFRLRSPYHYSIGTPKRGKILLKHRNGQIGTPTANREKIFFGTISVLFY